MSDLGINSECTTIVKWKLANFSTVASRDDPNKNLCSDYFQLDSSDIRCRLKFDPINRQNSGKKSHSSLFLYVTDFSNNFNIKFRLKFWIENELGDKTAEHPETEHVFTKTSLGWGHSNFVYHDKLYSSKNDFVKNDIVFLCCQILRQNASAKLKTKFHQKLWNSYKEGFTGECTLQVNGTKFKVSETVLTAHSDHFKQILKSSMKIRFTGVIKMNDFNVKTIKALIEYLHLESVNNLSDVALELFKLADMYEINEFKTYCEKSLVDTINNDNFRDCLILAFKYSLKDLKPAVLDYIARSNDGIFNSIISSHYWIQWSAENEWLSSQIVAAVLEKLDIKH